MAESFTVTQVNNYIKNLFARDFVLNRVTVTGEVSNCKYHTSGHIYFTLKDSGGSINCIMFATQRQGLTFRLADGQKIDASGQISVYEKSGSYQLYVRKCSLSGEGELFERYLKLKAELEEMGMFDDIYKKEIPAYCTKVGVVTAMTGAAIRDIVNVSKRRNPYVELILCPAQVQGNGAAESVARGIRRLDAMGLDVIIVGRGGGSIEDLWAFNEEIVARAIFEAETPIISAVGHETDFTIADFVSDLRAPTPSAAAELANFEYRAFMQELDSEKQMLRRAIEYKLHMLKAELQAKQEQLKRLSPISVLDARRRRLHEDRLRMQHIMHLKAERADRLRESMEERLHRTMQNKQDIAKHTLERYVLRLDSLSPLKKMSSGYGYVTDAEGKNLRSVDNIQKGELIKTYLQDGIVSSSVISIEKA